MNINKKADSQFAFRHTKSPLTQMFSLERHSKKSSPADRHFCGYSLSLDSRAESQLKRVDRSMACVKLRNRFSNASRARSYDYMHVRRACRFVCCVVVCCMCGWKPPEDQCRVNHEEIAGWRWLSEAASELFRTVGCKPRPLESFAGTFQFQNQNLIDHFSDEKYKVGKISASRAPWFSCW